MKDKFYLWLSIGLMILGIMFLFKAKYLFSIILFILSLFNYYKNYLRIWAKRKKKNGRL